MIVSSSSTTVPVENVCDSCCVSPKEVWFRLNFDRSGVFKGFSRLCSSSVSGFVVVLVVGLVVVVDLDALVVVVVVVVLLVVFRRFGLYLGRFVEVFFLNL